MTSDDPMAAGRAFVERGRARGKSDQELRQTLQASGWSEAALNTLWSRLGPAPAPTPAAPQPPPRARRTRGTTCSPTGSWTWMTSPGRRPKPGRPLGWSARGV